MVFSGLYGSIELANARRLQAIAAEAPERPVLEEAAFAMARKKAGLLDLNNPE